MVVSASRNDDAVRAAMPTPTLSNGHPAMMANATQAEATKSARGIGYTSSTLFSAGNFFFDEAAGIRGRTENGP